jgi:hypothetical protein
MLGLQDRAILPETADGKSLVIYHLPFVIAHFLNDK